VSEKKKKILNFKVRGEDPTQSTSALYSNFLAVARVGNEVQFEFIFLDLSKVATMIEQLENATETVEPPDLQGKTVAKVIMPAASLIQLKEHFNRIFSAIEEMTSTPEVKNARNRNAG